MRALTLTPDELALGEKRTWGLQFFLNIILLRYEVAYTSSAHSKQLSTIIFTKSGIIIWYIAIPFKHVYTLCLYKL